MRGNLAGQAVTICRDGQKLWAYPDLTIEALIATQNLPKSDSDFTLAPFQLPVTDKELVFLPVLFKVHDQGGATLDGADCRILDVTLMPELARSLKVQGWVARLWVRSDYSIAKFDILLHGWHVVVSVKKLIYAPSLPAESWQPSPDEAKDVTQITPSRFKQLLDAAAASIAAAKKPAANTGGAK